MEPDERFEAGQKCHVSALAIYQATKTWPIEERFGLSAEIRRAARSVSTNIVEGSAKRRSAEFRRFLDISVGSMAEVGYLLRLARGLGLLSEASYNQLEKLRSEAAKPLWFLYRSVEQACARRR